MDVTYPPPPGDAPGSGFADPETAFRTRYPNLSSFAMYAWGSDQPAEDVSELGSGPVWIVAGDETFMALSPGSNDPHNWFAYPARFVGCRTPPPESLRTFAPGSDPSPDASPFPIRWMLEQPILYTDGAWVFRGFVQNNFSSVAWNITLEITFPSGEVLVHPIDSRLEPGERVEYVYRVARAGIDGWKAHARYRLSEWP